MKTTYLALAFSLIVAGPVLAEEVKIGGTTCWTGENTGLLSSDAGWWSNWELTSVYTDDESAEYNTFNRCIGSSQRIDGERSDHWTCVHYYDDDSTIMSGGNGLPGGGSEARLISGTGRFEGVSGSRKGEPAVSRNAPEGEFAACRTETTTMTLP
ncbi:MAG: hypothetical protein V2J42_01830 [Wenzhouxiangella sp.]|jgi:hypothetical protein|nr:hypothetical protein [Wenzhouxiangella sp.]